MASLQPESTILLPDAPPPVCIYCGEPVEKTRGRGEHIFQDALRGAKTLKNKVCGRCNNEFSDIDRELCSRSFLSVVASQEIDGYLALVWDVDHTAGNLLVEARPVWHDDYELKALIAYPQITFEKHGADFRGDAIAIGSFGRENLEAVLKKAALSAFQRYTERQRDSIQFEQCQSSATKNGHRLAPRLYAHRTIEQIAAKMTKEKFYLRYESDADKNFALDCLSKLHRQRPSQKYTEYKGSHTPTIGFYYDVNKAIRALLKIGYNLVASVCEGTQIARDLFPEVASLVRGTAHLSPAQVASFGFVRHGDAVTSLAAPNKGHAALISHVGGLWHVHLGFFGGRMGAYVNFPGPHDEAWASMRIVAPLGSADWEYTPSRLAQVMKVEIDHIHSKLVCPSLTTQRTISELQVEVKPSNPRPR